MCLSKLVKETDVYDLIWLRLLTMTLLIIYSTHKRLDFKLTDARGKNKLFKSGLRLALGVLVSEL
jgi:hypothetical protein